MYGATSRTKAPREPSFPAPFALQETRTTWSPVSASAALSSITTTGSPWCEPTCVRMGMSLELGPIAPCTIYEGSLEDFRIGTPEAAFPTRCLIFKYSSLLIPSSVLLPLFCFTSVWNLLSETIPEPRHLHSQTYSKWRNGQIYTAWHEGVSFVYHGFHRQVLTHFDLMINVSCCRWDQLRILNIVLSRKMTILYECMGESVRTGMWDTISRRGLTTPWLHFSHSFKIFLSQN